MAAKKLNLQRKPPDATWGLRIGILLAVVAIGVALFLFNRAGGTAVAAGSGGAAEPTLTAALLDTYLDNALEVRRGRREASEAGWSPSTWQDYPRVADALERAGWTMRDYMRVEGQVNAARLELVDPGSVHDPDDPNSRPVPDAHLQVVRERLAEVRRAQAPL